MAEQDQPSTDLVKQASEEIAGEASEELGRLMGTIFGSASIEVDRILGNEVGYFRLKRALRIGEKTRKLLEKHGLTPQQVPHRTAVPLLEAASLEDDEGLQDRWAALLANATAQTMDVPPSFANVLRELDPIAARVLELVHRTLADIAVEIQADFGMNTVGLAVEIGIEQEAFDFHVDNLMRLGVLRGPQDSGATERTARLTFTAFGRAFRRACQPPGTPELAVRWTDATALHTFIRERTQREAEEAAARDAAQNSAQESSDDEGQA